MNDAIPKRPERRFTVTIEVGGDTLADVVSLLKHFRELIEKGSPSCVTGGYSSSGTFAVHENQDVTHDSFVKELNEYLEMLDAHKSPEAA